MTSGFDGDAERAERAERKRGYNPDCNLEHPSCNCTRYRTDMTAEREKHYRYDYTLVGHNLWAHDACGVVVFEGNPTEPGYDTLDKLDEHAELCWKIQTFFSS